MRALLIIFLVITAVAHQVHAKETTDVNISRFEYYADLPFWESPIQLFKGQNPITQSQASEMVHVRVGYDHLNRVIDIQARHGDKLKPFYRGFGSLYLYAPHTRVTYSEHQVTLSFYNLQGYRTKVLGDVWSISYGLDQFKRFVDMTYLDKMGKPIENQYGYARYDWLYVQDGSVIESRTNLKGELLSHRPGFEFKRIRLFFAPDGHLSLMQNIDENGELVHAKSGAAQYRYFYNSVGGFDRWEVYDKHGKPALGPTGTAGEQYTFNDKGWKKIAFFNKKGEPGLHASGAANWHAAYDKFGNMTARWFTDKQGNNVLGRFGFHKVKYIYDDMGMYQVRHEFYDENNKLTTNIDGVAKVVFSTDNFGNLQTQYHLDASAKLAFDQWRKFARAKFHYNEHGEQTGSDKFDQHGAKL